MITETRKMASALYVEALKLAGGNRAAAAEALTVAMAEMERRVEREHAKEESEKAWEMIRGVFGRFGVEIR